MELDEFHFLFTAGLLRIPQAEYETTHLSPPAFVKVLVLNETEVPQDYSHWLNQLRSLKPNSLRLASPGDGTPSPPEFKREDAERYLRSKKRYLQVSAANRVFNFEQTVHLSRKYLLQPEDLLAAIEASPDARSLLKELERSVNATSIRLDGKPLPSPFLEHLISVRGRELFDESVPQITRPPFRFDFSVDLVGFFEQYDADSSERAKLDASERPFFIPYPKQAQLLRKINVKEFLQLADEQKNSARVWEEVAKYLKYHVLFGSDRDAIDGDSVREFLSACDQTRFLCLSPAELIVAAQRGAKACGHELEIPDFLATSIRIPATVKTARNEFEDAWYPTLNPDYFQILIYQPTETFPDLQPVPDYRSAKHEFRAALADALKLASSIDIASHAPLGLAAYLLDLPSLPDPQFLPASLSTNKKDLYRKILNRVEPLIALWPAEKLISYLCAKLSYLNLPYDHKEVIDFVEPTPEMIRVVNRLRPARDDLEIASLNTP